MNEKVIKALDQLDYSIHNHLKNRLAPPKLMRLANSLKIPINAIKNNLTTTSHHDIMLKFQLHLIEMLQKKVYEAHQIPDYQILIPKIKHVLISIQKTTKEV